MRLFHVASDEEIKSGGTTDVYFVRTKRILEAKGLASKRAYAEVTASNLPRGYGWGVFCGLEETLRLFEGYRVDVKAMPEGTIFRSHDQMGFKVPVLTVEGPYGEYCVLETPMLGLICEASGIATAAARMRKLVGNEKTLLSFGIRRMHPAISPMIDRAIYIGGFDAVSSLSGAKIIGRDPVGTMPHALIIVMGDQVEAWKAFDEVIEKDVPRVALIDTYYDEKIEAIMAAESLGERLYGVRLDTPGSRRGDFKEIVREVRWELDARGFKNVKIFVSGGIDEEVLVELSEAGVDGFGVGTSISNAHTIDFALDLVEMEGRMVAKRGKLGGRKQVWRCDRCLQDLVKLAEEDPPKCRQCGESMNPLLKEYIAEGKIIQKLPKAEEIRRHVLEQLNRIGSP
ncbi:MAG: nicotinate phosphoribosyltransferase [Candidatus Bathyarchaeia archaeon]